MVTVFQAASQAGITSEAASDASGQQSASGAPPSHCIHGRNAQAAEAAAATSAKAARDSDVSLAAASKLTLRHSAPDGHPSASSDDSGGMATVVEADHAGPRSAACGSSALQQSTADITSDHWQQTRTQACKLRQANMRGMMSKIQLAAVATSWSNGKNIMLKAVRNDTSQAAMVQEVISETKARMIQLDAEFDNANEFLVESACFNIDSMRLKRFRNKQPVDSFVVQPVAFRTPKGCLAHNLQGSDPQDASRRQRICHSASD